MGHQHPSITIEKENGCCKKRCDWAGGGASAKKKSMAAVRGVVIGCLTRGWGKTPMVV